MADLHARPARRPRPQRRARSAVAAAALVLALSACGGGDSEAGGGATTDGDVTTLTWQMWANSQIETDALNRLSEMVTEQHPDIRLELQTSSFADYWTKLTAQASGGDVACLLGVQGPRVPLIADLLRPLPEDELQAAGIDMADFNQEMAASLQVDGTQVAVPYDLGPLVVFFNADAFEAAGVPLPEPGWTVEDFTAAAEALQASGINAYGFFPSYDAFTAWSLTLTGQQAIGDDGELNLDTPEMIGVFETLQAMREQGLSPALPATNDGLESLNQYMAGTTAMVVDGPWQYGNIVQNAAFTPGVAPMPAGPDGSASHLAGSGYGVSSSCSAPEEAVRALSVLTGPEALQHLGEIGRAYPARTEQAASWYQGELADAQPALEYAIENSTYLRTNPQMNQLGQLFQQYGIPAFNGQQDAESFLQQIQSQVGGS
ncbi:ABC transporter substrate-binding protein [Kineococcus sp. SYSU DK004]|uniref:ABC transporter substrate-binding protein n=1 Tax=Kineococcus sp. SYSU DK004 TaxID=3383125 RepID=UPI003D7ED3AC